MAAVRPALIFQGCMAGFSRSQSSTAAGSRSAGPRSEEPSSPPPRLSVRSSRAAAGPLAWSANSAAAFALMAPSRE